LILGLTIKPGSEELQFRSNGDSIFKVRDKEQMRWYSSRTRPKIRPFFCAEGIGSVFTALGK